MRLCGHSDRCGRRCKTRGKPFTEDSERASRQRSRESGCQDTTTQVRHGGVASKARDAGRFTESAKCQEATEIRALRNGCQRPASLEDWVGFAWPGHLSGSEGLGSQSSNYLTPVSCQEVAMSRVCSKSVKILAVMAKDSTLIGLSGQTGSELKASLLRHTGNVT